LIEASPRHSLVLPTLRGRFGQRGRLLILAASLFPIALVVSVIVQNGVNAPFVDQWETSFRLAILTLDGNLTLQPLIAFHNEHRILFTNLVTVISTRFFGWNLYLELFVTVALALGLLSLLLALVRHDFPQLTWILLVPLSALIFWLRRPVFKAASSG
jgi:hypothetical protein